MRSTILWRWYISLWTLSIVLFLPKISPCFIWKHNVSENIFNLRVQIKPTQMGPIDRASPYLRRGFTWITVQNEEHITFRLFRRCSNRSQPFAHAGILFCFLLINNKVLFIHCKFIPVSIRQRTETLDFGGRIPQSSSRRSIVPWVHAMAAWEANVKRLFLSHGPLNTFPWKRIRKQQ
jgi:hypothetical protein